MRYLIVSEYGNFLGLEGERLVVRADGEVLKEAVLSRLRTVFVTKKGVSLSSDLILACAARGIRIFFLDWRNVSAAALAGANQHATALFREKQFLCIRSQYAGVISAEIISSKIRNQRSVLNYFRKGLPQGSPEVLTLRDGSESLNGILKAIGQMDWLTLQHWKDELLGLEGAAANIYWSALASTGLLPKTFLSREGRGSLEITNAMLNYGYAILMSQIWTALDTAGFELYAGLFHAFRPGKPSLVLDVMEEYRAWVVDRNVIKLRFSAKGKTKLDAKLKKEISDGIFQTLEKRFPYHGKLVRLDNIVQRQVYRLAGAVADGSRYRGYSFKW
ncbi:MAG: CRISPR-associated endonuclease Cas1 [Duodenibacillus sp.]|nr:CRISPR-associated endonuclease Cas1 [Duodenibacillus sp.]